MKEMDQLFNGIEFLVKDKLVTIFGKVILCLGEWNVIIINNT